MKTSISKTAHVCSVTLIVGALLFGSSFGWAQQKANTIKEQLVGTWALVSADEVGKDGSRKPNFGPNPKGTMMFDANGRYSAILMSSSRPKFAAGSRAKGTPEENATTVGGTLAYYGTYSVDEVSKTLISSVEGSTFPNSEGQQQKRTITSLTANELKYTNPATTTGGTAEAVWRRVK
jgi:lipocalin-like protein